MRNVFLQDYNCKDKMLGAIIGDMVGSRRTLQRTMGIPRRLHGDGRNDGAMCHPGVGKGNRPEDRRNK